ncbi:MAG: hypothetical protein H6822_21465 [Planctomycetaceae bacterium]|nr:hypothetical protein [Planctomycetales bacterium]MCB9924764.1 hypothetical protein [Planctomycetaceae bacterium]
MSESLCQASQTTVQITAFVQEIIMFQYWGKCMQRVNASFVSLVLLGTVNMVCAADMPLDHAGLASVLDAMGYEYSEPSDHPPDTNYYEVNIRFGEATHVVHVSAHPNEKVIFVGMNLKGAIPASTHIPNHVLRGLLNANFAATSVFFSYEENTRQIRLAGTVPTIDFKAVLLRRTIDEIVSKAQATVKLWDYETWNADEANDVVGGEAKHYDYDSLKATLEELGYTFTTKHFESNGLPYYLIEEKRADRTYFVIVQLSDDKSYLWVTADFSALPEGAEIPPKIMQRMLEIGWSSLYMRFAFNPQTRSYRLEHPFDNSNLKPETLQKAISRASDILAQHVDVWDPELWPKATTVETIASEAKAATDEPTEKKGNDDAEDKVESNDKGEDRR